MIMSEVNLGPCQTSEIQVFVDVAVQPLNYSLKKYNISCFRGF